MSSDTARLVAGVQRLKRLRLEQKDEVRRNRKARHVASSGKWRDAVAERIDALVQRAGGPTAFARRYRIPVNSVANWASGRCVPSVSQAIVLAKATKIPLSELVAADIH